MLLSSKKRPDLTGDLFEKLRELRKQVAAELGIPPYMVFHDRSLQVMSQEKPRSPEEMQTLYGVGERKFVKYGSRFLDVIRQHCSAASSIESGPSERHERPIEGKTYSVEDIRKDHPKAYAPWSEKENQHLELAFLAGRPIPRIAEELGRNEGAIRSRLKKLGLIV